MADLKEKADALLSVTAIANLSTESETTIYTVPVGKTLILTKALLRVAGDVGGSCDVSIGRNGAETDFIASSDLDEANAAGDVMLLAPIPSVTQAAPLKEYVAGTLIKFDVINAGNAVVGTLYLYGTLDDA